MSDKYKPDRIAETRATIDIIISNPRQKKSCDLAKMVSFVENLFLVPDNQYCDRASSLDLVQHLVGIIHDSNMITEVQNLFEMCASMHKQLDQLATYCQILRQEYHDVCRQNATTNLWNHSAEDILKTPKSPPQQCSNRAYKPILDEHGRDIVAESIDIVRSVRSSQKFEELSASVFGSDQRRSASDSKDKICKASDMASRMFDDGVLSSLVEQGEVHSFCGCDENSEVDGIHAVKEYESDSDDDSTCRILSSKINLALTSLHQQEALADVNGTRIRRLEDTIVKRLFPKTAFYKLSAPVGNQPDMSLVSSLQLNTKRFLTGLSPTNEISGNELARHNEQDWQQLRLEIFNRQPLSTSNRSIKFSSSDTNAADESGSRSRNYQIGGSALNESLRRIARKLQDEEAYLVRQFVVDDSNHYSHDSQSLRNEGVRNRVVTNKYRNSMHEENFGVLNSGVTGYIGRLKEELSALWEALRLSEDELDRAKIYIQSLQRNLNTG